jgi:hypothetical protein
MDARFFVLAFLAALNPKLFAVDLLLMESRRPRLMFLCFLAGCTAAGGHLPRQGSRSGTAGRSGS